MKELINRLDKAKKADYLLDTCFLIYEHEQGRTKELNDFCSSNKVGMTSFNLSELEHAVKKMPGPISRHVRQFLKQKLVKRIEVGVVPGDREGEKKYVTEFDPKVLEVVPDPSDAVMFVLALKIKADILTRDRHHVFNCAAENYSNNYRIKIRNKIPEQ
jgi:hypothetical protein